MIAHIDVPGENWPWVEEFFGHPNEYWLIYLLIMGLVGWLIYLTNRGS